MINRALHAITNRAGGFNTPTLLADSTFQPAAETPDTRRLRALLGVDRTADDYHIFAVLAAIESCPDIITACQDPVRSYALQDYRKPAPVYSGGLPVADASGAPQCRLLAAEVPVPPSLTLTYVDADFADVRYGRQRSIVPVSSVNGSIYPSWPAHFGFSGGVQLTWGPSATFTVQAWPVRFPYEALAETLTQDPGKNELLGAADLLNEFYLAPTALRKVALVALALGLANPAVYGR